MATELMKKEVSFGGGNEAIVIVNRLGDIPGGVSLNTEGYTLPEIKAGQVVYKDADGSFKPLPVSGEAYDEAIATAELNYVGVVVRSVPTSAPSVAVMTIGQVNGKALPYPVTDEIKTALRGKIEFLHV